MSKNLPETPKTEEVDLGQLFKLIGDAFQRLIDFITSIFKGIFKILLTVLTHIFNRLIWYGIAVVLGLVVGFLMDISSDDIYGANLNIETNFNSTHQVYENLKYLHQLASVDKDSVELARKLKISVKDASTIKGVYIEPDIDENDRIRMFVIFKKGLDSTARADYTYKDYIESLNYYSFKRHRIGVAATDRFVFQKLNKNFVNTLVDNDYLKKLNETTLANLELEKIALEKQEEEIDSLAKEYLKIRQHESEKEPVAGTGTNLYMGNAQQSELLVDESALLSSKTQIEASKRRVNIDMVKDNNIINVLAKFPDAGYDISDWTDKMSVRLPALFFLITFFGFIFYGLGKYLSEQDKKLKQQ